MGVPVVSVFGEIDLSSAPKLDALITRAITQAGDTGCVVVDLGGVEFMDIVGLGSLIRGRAKLLKEIPEGMFVVVCGGQVRRLVEVAELTEVFVVYPDLHSAVEECLKPRLDP
jgi:anti-anti-sigma factor